MGSGGWMQLGKSWKATVLSVLVQGRWLGYLPLYGNLSTTIFHLVYHSLFCFVFIEIIEFFLSSGLEQILSIPSVILTMLQ